MKAKIRVLERGWQSHSKVFNEIGELQKVMPIIGTRGGDDKNKVLTVNKKVLMRKNNV